MREYFKNPLAALVAVVLYTGAVWYFSLLPRDQIILLFRDTPEGVAGLLFLIAGIAWTLRNELP